LRKAVVASTGPPAARQAPKPPAMWATGFKPIRCATSVASAERWPAAQKNTNRLSSAKMRIDPEFEHAARAMEGARHTALAGELADIAQIDKHDVIAAMERERLAGGQSLDCALGRLDHCVHVNSDVLRHRSCP
jgi:hypothetical protein